MISSCKNEINISDKESLIFFWNEDTKNLAFFQNIVNIHNKGKDILIIAGGNKHTPIIIPFHANETLKSGKYNLVSSIDSTRIMKFSNEGYNQIQLVQSRLNITITDGLVSEIYYTVTARKSFDYLDATSPNSSTDYIPTLNNHPATKKYVDDVVTESINNLQPPSKKLKCKNISTYTDVIVSDSECTINNIQRNKAVGIEFLESYNPRRNSYRIFCIKQFEQWCNSR